MHTIPPPLGRSSPARRPMTAVFGIALAAALVVLAPGCELFSTSICEPGATRCNGPGVEQCAASGVEWVAVESCPADATCSAGACECPRAETPLAGECVSTMPMSLAAPTRHPDIAQDYIPGELLLQVASGSLAGAALEAAASVGADLVSYAPGARAMLVRFDASLDVTQLEDRAVVLEGDSAIDSAALNWAASAPVRIPADAGWAGEAWSTDEASGANWALELIAAPAAWDVTTGESGTAVRVGIMDFGKIVHTDVVGQLVDACMVTDTDACGSDTTATSIDVGSVSAQHGQAVAGVIAATGNNNLGLTGVAWRADVYYCEMDGTDARIASCLDWLTAREVRVINGSFGLYFREKPVAGGPAGWETPFRAGTAPWLNAHEDAWHTGRVLKLQATVDALNADWLFVQAAGNEALERPEYGSEFGALGGEVADRVMLVGAATLASEVANYSNRSTAAVDLMAPGGDGALGGVTVLIDWDTETTATGTSFAAPHVAGAAVLALSVNPWLTGAELADTLLQGSAAAGQTVTDTLWDGSVYHLLNLPGVVEEAKQRCADATDLELGADGLCIESAPEEPTTFRGDCDPACADDEACLFGSCVPRRSHTEWSAETTNKQCVAYNPVRTQADIAALEGCGELLTPLEISDAELVNLDGLEGLWAVRGLTIRDNPQLVDVDGLAGLRRVGDEPWAFSSGDPLESFASIEVEDNPALVSLDGLAGVQQVRSLEVRNNGPGLQQLPLLLNLERQKLHWVSIYSNDGLTSLAGLRALEEVDDLDVDSNDGLTSLGLDALQAIHDGYGISFNEHLPQCLVDALVAQLSVHPPAWGLQSSSFNDEAATCN